MNSIIAELQRKSRLPVKSEKYCILLFLVANNYVRNTTSDLIFEENVLQ